MNHKNFVNLIGYCEEQKPFTRMMVFEYAPNGTLFDHLHSKFFFSLILKRIINLRYAMCVYIFVLFFVVLYCICT